MATKIIVEITSDSSYPLLVSDIKNAIEVAYDGPFSLKKSGVNITVREVRVTAEKASEYLSEPPAYDQS